jgi:hypothetical protein
MKPPNFIEPMHVSNVYMPGSCMSRPFLDRQVCGVHHTKRKNTILFMEMGPVTTAVGLYAVERLLTRIMAGQIHRKGVIRKVRRLLSMVTEFHMMWEMMQDVIEDMCT